MPIEIETNEANTEIEAQTPKLELKIKKCSK